MLRRCGAAIQGLSEACPGGQQLLAEISVVGHRVVHGGAQFSRSVLIDDAVVEAIARWSELAPLHNPPALAAIAAAESALPHARQVAVFDTAFFAACRPARMSIPCPTPGMRIGVSAVSAFTALATSIALLERPKSSPVTRLG